mgnify:CR=1 FL=1
MSAVVTNDAGDDYAGPTTTEVREWSESGRRRNEYVVNRPGHLLGSVRYDHPVPIVGGAPKADHADEASDESVIRRTAEQLTGEFHLAAPLSPLACPQEER